MFGIDATLLAFIALAGCSAGAVAYAFLFNTIDKERTTERRLDTVKRAETDRSVVKASRDRAAEAAKRRKSVQDSLKDLDAKQLAADKNIKKPPLRVQLRQAGLQVTVERFYIYSLACGLLVTA
jgi:tight adherence protein B